MSGLLGGLEAGAAINCHRTDHCRALLAFTGREGSLCVSGRERLGMLLYVNIVSGGKTGG